MKMRAAMMGFFLLVSVTAWGQMTNKAGIRRVHPEGMYMSSVGHASMQIQAAASIVAPLIVRGAPAGNVVMAYNASTGTCLALTVTNANLTPVAKEIFSVDLPNSAPGSTYVDVMFTSNLNFYPGANALGASIDCRVEQDTDGDGSYETSYNCSGISDSLKPWLAFDPSTNPLGSAFQTTYRGYAVIPGGLILTGLNAGKAIPTRVVVNLFGVEWNFSGSPSGLIDACNNTLKIMY